MEKEFGEIENLIVFLYLNNVKTIQLILFFLCYIVCNTCILSQNNLYKKIFIDGTEYYLYPEFETESEPDDLNRYDVYKLHKGDKHIVIDGKWVKLYNNPDTTKVAIFFNVEDNLLNGKFSQFYYNGTIQLTGEYFKDSYNGKWFYFREDGKIYETKNYIIEETPWGYNDYNYGEWKYWDENNTLRKVKHYDSLGNKTGQWENYYENGKLFNTANYKNGFLEGEIKYFTKNGTLRFSGYYQSNQCSNINTFYSTGSINGEGSSYLYSKTGKWKYLYENGNIKAIGQYKLYKSTICISSVSTDYYHSVKSGRWIYRYENGNVMAYGDYIGYSTETTRGIILQSKKNKEWSYFDEEGNITTCEYLKSKGIDLTDKHDAFLTTYDEANE